MMKRAVIPILYICIFAVLAKKRYDGYQILEVQAKDRNDAEILHDLEVKSMVDFHTAIMIGRPITIMVSPNQLDIIKHTLSNAGISYQVTNTNIQRLIDEEENRLQNKMAFDIDDFNTLEDIYNQLSVWARSCPSGLTCAVYKIGTTAENRDINAIRIGNGNPVILYDTLIHAREWLTAATTLKMLDHIINNYGTDDEVTSLLDKYDVIFVPVLNPDGYDFTWTNNRNWRKNRAVNDGSECIGVDLMRNFAVDEWCMQGASTDPCSCQYCGTSAGSELETRALQNEILRLQAADESGIIAYVNMHSYAWMWMFPPGYTENFTPFTDCVHFDDYDEQYAITELIQEAIFQSSGDMWDIGTSCEAIYPTTGGNDDWSKAKAGVKNAYCAEIRGPAFVVPPTLIQPSFEENWAALIAMMTGIEANES